MVAVYRVVWKMSDEWIVDGHPKLEYSLFLLAYDHHKLHRIAIPDVRSHNSSMPSDGLLSRTACEGRAL